MAQSYRDLLAWKKAMQLVTEVYRQTETFPKEELYGLTSQLRASSYIGSMQYCRRSRASAKGEFQQFLGYARGSLLEVETLVLLATELKYVDAPNSRALLDLSAEVGKILNGLLNSLSKS